MSLESLTACFHPMTRALALRGRLANLTLGFKSNAFWLKDCNRNIAHERFKSEVAYRSDPVLALQNQITCKIIQISVFS